MVTTGALQLHPSCICGLLLMFFGTTLETGCLVVRTSTSKAVDMHLLWGMWLVIHGVALTLMYCNHIYREITENSLPALMHIRLN